MLCMCRRVINEFVDNHIGFSSHGCLHFFEEVERENLLDFAHDVFDVFFGIGVEVV